MTSSRHLRATYPGRVQGIVEWPKEDPDSLQASIQPEQGLWEAFLESEDRQGFITSEMIELFLEHAQGLFPEYALKDKRKLTFNKQFQAAAVDPRLTRYPYRATVRGGSESG